MTHIWLQTLTGATAIYCWLIAGVFLAFSDFVMKSLGALPAPQGIAAMQSINILVFRSVFMVGLFAICASSIFLIGYTYVTAAQDTGLIVTAGLLYIVTVMIVSIIGNIPLNNKLAALDANSNAAKTLWPQYLVRWVRWNHIRTIGAATSAAMLTLATFQLA